MPKVRVHNAGTEEFVTMRSLVPPADQSKFSATELDSMIRFIEPGTDESLQLFEVDYLPGSDIEIHAHDEDEIIYILDGEMHVGNRVLARGASIFVAGNTLYGFKAGPQGMRMLNFRPRRDNTFIRKEEYKRK